MTRFFFQTLFFYLCVLSSIALADTEKHTTSNPSETTDVQHQLSTDKTKNAYFLNLEQKKQLLLLGHIQDQQGQWYNVSIVPGYAKAGNMAKDNLIESASEFSEYAQSKKYRHLFNESRRAFKWSYQKALKEYMLTGSKDAWGNYYKSAQVSTDKRVFGWWLAYPWATFKGVVNIAFRLTTGSIGVAGGVVYASAISPSYHLLNSAIEGSYQGIVEGIVLPTGIAGWNTLIAPPMALLGQKPAAQRSDDFWISMVDDPSQTSNNTLNKQQQLKLHQLDQIASESQLSDQQRRQIEQHYHRQIKQHQQQISALHRQLNAEIKNLNLHEKEKVYDAEGHHLLFTALNDQQAAKLRHSLLQHIKQSREYSAEQKKQLARILSYPRTRTTGQSSRDNRSQQLKPKSDPLSEADNVIRQDVLEGQ